MTSVVDEKHYANLVTCVSDWQTRSAKPNRPTLQYRKALTSIMIEDSRVQRRRTYTYNDGQAALYEFCADARTPHEVETDFGTATWVRDALDDFVGKGLMLFMDSRYLSLALPENQNFDVLKGRAKAVPEAAGPPVKPESVPLVELTLRRST